MDPFNQRVVIVGLAGLADRFAVGFQGGQQHRQHVRRQIRLAGGQAQAFFVIEHQQFAAALGIAAALR
ncbi:hypothetical protein D3C84_1179440 [compost metagenome]